MPWHSHFGVCGQKTKSWASTGNTSYTITGVSMGGDPVEGFGVASGYSTGTIGRLSDGGFPESYTYWIVVEA